MSRRKPTESPLWKFHNQEHVTKERVQNLANFKSGTVNFNIALWNPQTNGVRYLKTLTYNLCASLTPENWRRITKIKNRHIGNPFTVRYNGEEVCLDYLQASLELEFITKNVKVDGLSILEIGSGYGRTCHAILSNHKVKQYTIVDLENCLELSKNYLSNVLDKGTFSKIRFIMAEDLYLVPDLIFDLCINIDSFAEMDVQTVQYYLNYVRKNGKYLYVKNPVAKYLDEALDRNSQGDEVVQTALSSGVLLDVIDIHDNQAVKSKIGKFVEVYQPGSDWMCIDNYWAVPWSYYWQAMFKKVAGASY